MTEESLQFLEDKLQLLIERLRDRTEALPAHSLRPHQLIEIEELEEEVERLRQLVADRKKKA